MSENLDQQYWDLRYQNKETGWDIGYASPPLTEYFDQLTNKDISILIPGCGNAYEAIYLLEKGFTNVTLIDISPVITAKVATDLQQYLHKQLHIITGDFFQLNKKFDLIIEQTFFCALPVSLREDYASKIKDLLLPGGKLVGVLFNRQFNGGPPFGGNKEEYQHIFSRHFNELKIVDCYNSIPPRQGSEVFIIAKSGT